MIVLNDAREGATRHCGICRNASFRVVIKTMADNPNDAALVIATFEEDWDGKNHTPVAEAFLRPGHARHSDSIHTAILVELDRLGVEGNDIGSAIERVLTNARDQGVVTSFENNARPLLSDGGSGSASSTRNRERLLGLMKAVEDRIGRFPVQMANGETTVDAALLSELDKPENQGLRSLLKEWL